MPLSCMPDLFRDSKVRTCFLLLAMIVSPPLVSAQNSTASSSSGCPIQLTHFNPGGLTVRVKNSSGKTIVGLVFNAALADATEHWKWYHWDFDNSRPIRDFGWNKSIKNGDSKNLSWNLSDLNFEHGGGGAFVLTSALFEDGTVWEESKDNASCKYVWYNSHKKSFARPVLLPFRE